MSEKLVSALGGDRLPFHQREARVTDLMDLRGVLVAVTAGAGPILGSAIVDRMAGLGASVAVVDVDEAAAQEVADKVASRWDVPTTAIGADATDPAAAVATVAAITERLGPVDVWVNNLGLTLGDRPFWERPIEEIDRVVALNYSATMYCAHAVLPQMLDRNRGRIINIASEGGKSWIRGLTVYNSAKSAVIGFTRNLAHELQGTGVSTVAVCPGIMLTEAVLERMRDLPEGAAGTIPQALSRLSADRGSLPEEVANMVAFLATEAGAYVEATAVSVGGGMTDW